MQFLGTVVRLQVQASSLKLKTEPAPRRYDPKPLHSVRALTVTPAGAVGLREDGESIVDVHHLHHPASKNHAENGISLGFTAHYATMRDRFGEHLRDGIAGENILIETGRQLQAEELAGGVVIEGKDGARLNLQQVIVAAPCVEFTRYALRFPDEARPDRTVTEALQFLHDGMRGFYATYDGGPVVIQVGSRAFLT